MSKSQLALVALLLFGAAAVVYYRSQVFSESSSNQIRPKLVVVSGGTGPYWQLLSSGAKAAAGDIDAEVEILTPERDEDLEGQMQLLTKIKLDSVDGVALSPLDAEKQTLWVNRIADQAFIVTVDSDAPLSNRLSYIGASNLAAGYLCAKLAKEAAPQGGKVIVLLANLTKDNMQERKLGLEESLAANSTDEVDNPARYEIVDFLADEGDYERCAEQLKQAIADNDDLACVVGLNAYHGGIILKELRASDLIGKLPVVVFDTEQETLDGIENGDIYATVAQDPYQYGYEAVRILADYCRRSEPSLPLIGARSTVTIGAQAVRKDNLQAFRKSYDKRLQEAAPAKTAAG